MIRILQALLCGVLLGFGIGSGLFEMWLISAGCFVASIAALFLFVRGQLRRAV